MGQVMVVPRPFLLERLSPRGGGELPPRVIDQAFPIEEVDLGKRHRLVSEHQDGAQAVGVIGRAVGRLPGLCGAYTHPFDKADFNQRLRIEQILYDIVARLVHIRLDAPRSLPGRSKAPAQAGAHLPDPDRLALVAKRRQPETQRVRLGGHPAADLMP
jgi:hypothetical protein